PAARATSWCLPSLSGATGLNWKRSTPLVPSDDKGSPSTERVMVPAGDTAQNTASGGTTSVPSSGYVQVMTVAGPGQLASPGRVQSRAASTTPDVSHGERPRVRGMRVEVPRVVVRLKSIIDRCSKRRAAPAGLQANENIDGVPP